MDRTNTNSLIAKIGILLRTNWMAKIGEILLLIFSSLALINIMKPIVGENLLLKQVVVWSAYILMLIIVWAGVKLRGESWRDFGLTFRLSSWKEGLRIFLLSILVFLFAMAGFILGSIIMANITGIPQSSDMSGYDYLKDNVGMFLLTLAGVYVVSSFGEEVIYRAFFINRIEQLGKNSKAIKVVAVVISSVVFGLVHYDWGPMGMVQTGFMGLALGISYVKLKKRLWILILAHAYMDTILMVQMYLASN